jgi:tetratricopeptide (TPR) repeat protein
MSFQAGFIRPDIFSYIFMALTVWTWFRIKSGKKEGWRLCYLLPALFLLWVNSHGGWIFGGIFLGILLVGELLNFVFAPEKALDSLVRRHFFISLSLCIVVIFITPYGWKYPSELLQTLVLGGVRVETLRNIADYTSILDARSGTTRYVFYLVMGYIILIVLLWPDLKKGKLDWTLILTNIVFACLYTQFMRTTYHWGIIFAFSSISLIPQQHEKIFAGKRMQKAALIGGIILSCIFISGQAVSDSFCRPAWGRWCGFGISYQNPVEEAAFIKKNLSGLRIGNDYNSSGYLLWALWPETKVFYAPPFHSSKIWYKEYFDFLSGIDPASFLRKYPFDSWCISFSYDRTVKYFLNSKDWRLVFYGATAAVFVRNEVRLSAMARESAESIFHIRNLNQTARVFAFVLSLKDLETAGRILESVNSRFKCPNQGKTARMMNLFFRGVCEYYHHNFQRATNSLSECEKSKIITNREILVNCYLYLAQTAYGNDNVTKAMEHAQSALNLDPDNLYALFNSGVLEWYTTRIERDKVTTDLMRKQRVTDNQNGKQYLRKFLERARHTSGVPGHVSSVAKEILLDKYNLRPFLIAPPLPSLE